MSESTYISSQEAAKRLGVSQETVESWIFSSILAGKKEAGATFAAADDVERLHAEFYGVPDLVFDQPEDAVPSQMSDSQ